MPRFVRSFLFWVLLVGVVSILAGLSSGFFLWSLELVQGFRVVHPWMVWFLPFAGFLSGWVYLRWAGRAEGGTNLVMGEMRQPDQVLPWQMAPMVLGGTLLTHLFGGSAGREGTAVQMATSLADQLSRPLRLDVEQRRLLLRVAVAAGFSAVFGTPAAGTVFALEVVKGKSWKFATILPCALAAWAADRVVQELPVTHVRYVAGVAPETNFAHLLAAVAAGLAFGFAARFFVAGQRSVSRWSKNNIAYAPFRPFLGGCLVAGAAILVGKRWLGLGVPLIRESFAVALPWWDSFAKSIFTFVTVGSGFKGGEVTPLFCIGSTLGSALSPWLGLPVPILAAMGFAAVFGAAANTPLACTVLCVELFGKAMLPYAAIACFFAWSTSGKHGIYGTFQRSK